jgi:hypothetical protein
MKVVGIMLFGVIGLAFFTDWYVTDTIYDSTGRGIEHALDASIVKTGIVLDAQQGNVQLKQSQLLSVVKQEFIRNQNLSVAMENSIMKDSDLQLHLEYDSEGVPWITATFHTKVSFMLPDVQYPVTVNRKIAYEGVYK